MFKLKLLFIILLLFFGLFNYEMYFKAISDAPYHYDNTLFMIATLCLGIIVSTAVYNLALAFYVHSRQHLYYALAQFSTLVFLIALDSLYIAPFDSVFGLRSVLVFDLAQLSMLIFSLLFIQAFSRHYVQTRLDKLIKVIIMISLADMLITLLFSHSVLSRFIPIFVPIWLVLSETNAKASHKDLPFYYLLYGWGIVLVMVAIEYIGFVDYSGIVFPFLHVALALDAIILSLAISYKFKLLDDEARLQQSLLLQQSRLASMGEMISIVAHQWRQPLTFLSFSLMGIKKRCDNKEGEKLIQDASTQLQHMSKTIENFSNFYNPSQTKETFDIHKACENILELFNPTSTLKTLKVNIDVQENFHFHANKNEFEQVLLNLINNAKDIFTERATQDPTLTIMINKPHISIIDNAGGIDKAIVEKVFEPYFSTKEGNDGIGLYIAKMIVEKKFQGTLSFQTDKKSTRFNILLPSTPQ